MSAGRVVPRRWAVAAGVTGGLLGTAASAGSLGVATYFARRVLTPDPRRPEDALVLDVDTDSVTLGRTADTTAAGRYGLWLDGGCGHVRLGEVLATEGDRVTRELLGIDFGRLGTGSARWNQYYFAGPPDAALGLETRDVALASEVGPLPAWEVPGTADGLWAVLVHGRGALREEGLRAVPVLNKLGHTCLIPMYRNDIGAPTSPDGRYNLGLSEWRDVEAAMLHAVEQGAREIVLYGVSMGGAMVLQTLDRSWLSGRVTRVVLDAPVIDWGDVLRHQAATNRIPAPVGLLGRHLLGRRWARRLVGVHETIDVAETDWVHRAGELSHPTLLIHSEDDDFVPSGPSAALAARRPDLVRYEPWRGAAHTREWNVDPQRWDRVVREFLTG